MKRINVVAMLDEKRKMEKAIYDAVKAAHDEFWRETGLTAEYIDIEMDDIAEMPGEIGRYEPVLVTARIVLA